MEDLIVNARCTIPVRDLSWRAVKASGPGGQNVNKVATKVELRFDLSGTEAFGIMAKRRFRKAFSTRIDAEGFVVVTSQATRVQSRNLEDAREKLADMIRQALVVPKRRRATKPTKGSQRRRLEDKRRQGEKKRTRGRVDH